MSKQITQEDLRASFDLAPEKAAEYLRSKGYAITFDWRELDQAAHERAFTVAKILRMDLLKKFREELQAAIDNGTTVQDFRKAMEDSLRDAGYWGKVEVTDPQTGRTATTHVTPSRLELIFRQNTQTAYMAGRMREQEALADVRPYAIYRDVRDVRETNVCKALGGKVFAVGSDIWRRAYPTNHFRCRSRMESMSERQLQRSGKRVESDKSWKNWKPAEGFNGPPTQPLQPDLAKYPADIAKLYNEKKKSK